MQQAATENQVHTKSGTSPGINEQAVGGTVI